jgi:hypothetical protein
MYISNWCCYPFDYVKNSQFRGRNQTTGYSQVRWEMIWCFALCVVSTSVLLQGRLYDIKRHSEISLHKKAVTATNKTPMACFIICVHFVRLQANISAILLSWIIFLPRSVKEFSRRRLGLWKPDCWTCRGEYWYRCKLTYGTGQVCKVIQLSFCISMILLCMK